MNNDETKKILDKIDNIELVPDEELENMDFYQLAYYMQTLNSINPSNNEEGQINYE